MYAAIHWPLAGPGSEFGGHIEREPITGVWDRAHSRSRGRTAGQGSPERLFALSQREKSANLPEICFCRTKKLSDVLGHPPPDPTVVQLVHCCDGL